MGISRAALVTALSLGIAGVSLAGETGDHLPPVRERFGAPGVAETPNFQRHVIPLLGRLGCNGRKCHGAFQGQNGFRLSLFGYDFAQDHQALAARVNREAPAESLVLRKPTLAEPHEGGERFRRGGWEHRLLQNWIAGGAKGIDAPGLSGAVNAAFPTRACSRRPADVL